MALHVPFTHLLLLRRRHFFVRRVNTSVSFASTVFSINCIRSSYRKRLKNGRTVMPFVSRLSSTSRSPSLSLSLYFYSSTRFSLVVRNCCQHKSIVLNFLCYTNKNLAAPQRTRRASSKQYHTHSLAIHTLNSNNL